MVNEQKEFQTPNVAFSRALQRVGCEALLGRSAGGSCWAWLGFDWRPNLYHLGQYCIHEHVGPSE